MDAKNDPVNTSRQIHEQDFPRTGSATDKMNFLIKYALLAPSGHNLRPWKFSVDENDVRIFVDAKRWLRVADSKQRELHIGVGCALENLLIAAEHFGYGHQVAYFPEPRQEELTVSIQFIPGGQPSPFRGPALFRAIPDRHTSRKVFNQRPIPQAEVDRLQACCVEGGIGLHMTAEVDSKQKITELLIRGHVAMLRDPAFRKETAYWVGQGIFKIPRIFAKLIQSLLPHMKVPSAIMSMMDTRLVMSSSLVAVLSTKVNNKEAQIKVGQAYERLCLAATAQGISAHPMSPIVEIPELRDQVVKMLPTPDVIPQHAFRLGYEK